GPYKELGNYSNQFIGTTNKADSSIISDSRYNYKTYRNAVNMNLQHFMEGHRREININLDYLQYANHPHQHLESNLYRPDDPLPKQYGLITESLYTALIYSTNVNY